MAGIPFIIGVTADDQFNNPVTSYSGTVHFTSSDPQVTAGGALPPDATLNGGIGFFAAFLETAGNQTITATDTVTSSITGASNTIVVSPAATYAFALTTVLPSYPGITSGPTSFATTGFPFPFMVKAEDQYGNTVPSYAGTVHFTSSDISTNVVLPADSTLQSGVGTFTATLGTPGNQTLIATDTLSGSINGHSNAIVTRGLVVTSFTPTPTGFVINFNEPFNPGAVLMYTEGTTPDDIMLATTGTQVSVRGSVLVNSPTAPTSITFVKTDAASAVGTFNPGSGLLSQGNYTVTLRSFNAGTGTGFADILGGALDGKDQANPGVNYVYTFSVSTPPTAVGLPDFARGPSNTDALFLPTTIGDGNTFNLIYTNPNTSPATGTATVTFSTIAATLQSNIQSALNALPQIGTAASNVPNGAAVISNPVTMPTQGANVLVTFQNSYFVTATNQVLASTTPGVSIALATINAPNNITGNGIPVALSNGQNVTSGSFTLQYNPTLLNITGAVPKVAGASFTVTTTINNATSATAVLSLSSPSRISSTTASLTIGSLLATVPFSATASYGAKQLLHFSSEQLNTTTSTNIAVTNQDAVEVAAFFGDVNDTGMPFASSGAVGSISTVAGLIPSTVFQTLPGFALFPDLDPAIIGSVAQTGQTGIVGNDTTIMNKQLTTGQAAIPFLPAGLGVTAVGPDPTLSVVDGGRWTVDSGQWTVIVPVNIDTARPEGSTGMVEAVLALTYDPRVFDVSAADVQLGTVPEGGSGWQLTTEVNAQTGLIGVELYSNTPIQSTAGGSLVTITMHVREPAPAATTALTLVPYVDPAGGPRVYQTSVADTQGEFVLHEAVDGESWTVGSGGSGGEIPSNGAQVTAMPISGAGGNVLPLAVLEQVFGDLAQIAAYSLQPNANFPLLTAYSLPPNATFPPPTANCLLLDGAASEAEEAELSALEASFAHEVFGGDLNLDHYRG